MEKEFDFKGLRINGILMIIIEIIILGVAVLLFFYAKEWGTLSVIAGVVLSVLHVLFWFGFILVEPNKACVLVFFGKYRGTVKENGFFFVHPFYSKKPLSLRANNLDVEPIKVNDKIGNPIMIGLVLVWKIEETYKALFDIDVDQNIIPINGGRSGVKRVNHYDRFVKVQSDAALRKLAGMYAYDNIDTESHESTLRAGGEEVNERLEHELGERLSIAGIKVVEARINYLAYASEIAGAMLRRQQAAAIIAAREKIVEGAVTMVQLALEKLASSSIVELDEDKKAAMVSNLMVVLCADDTVQPVINTGTLHQ